MVVSASASADRGFVRCSGCGLPAECPGFTEAIEFPVDVEAVAGLVNGTLNSYVHFCGKRLYFLPPLAVSWPAKRQMALAGAKPPDDLRRLADENGWSLAVLRDYNDLRGRVVTWIRDETGAFWQGISDRSFFDLAPRAAVEAVDGLQLLAMRLVRDGILVPLDRDGHAPSVSTRERINRLALAVAALHVERVIQLAIFDGRGDDLEAELRERIPVSAIDDPLLARLAEAAIVPWEEFEPANALQAYIRLVACAVAHRVMHRENPRVVDLAALLTLLFRLDADDQAEIDERMWLTPAQMRRLIDARTAWDAAAAVAQADTDGVVSGAAGRFLERVGWEELFSELAEAAVMRALGPSHRLREPEGRELLVTKIVDVLLGRRATEAGTDDPAKDFVELWGYGELAGNVANRLLTAVLDDAAQLIALERLADALARPDSIAIRLGFHFTVLKQANLGLRMKVMRFSAVPLLQDALQPDVPPGAAVDVLVEVGNAFRYLQQWEQSLRCYEIAEEISEQFTDDHAKKAKVFVHNRAIVLRDSGRYSEARTLLEELEAQQPVDPDVLLSVVSLYERIGRWEEAVDRADRALARIELSPELRRRFLLLRGLVLAGLGRQDEAARDCLLAWSVTAERDPHRMMCAGAALFTDPTDPELVDAADRCEAEVVEGLATAFSRYSAAGVTGGTAAALRRLRLGRIDAAGMLLKEIAVLAQDHDVRLPWQFTFALGWYEFEQGSAQALDRLEAAVFEVEERFPSGLDSSYMIAALADRGVDDLQRVATRAGIAATTAGDANADRMVAILDLAHGRDLTGRAASALDIPATGPECLAALAAWQEASGGDIVTVIDDVSSVRLLVEQAGDVPHIVDTGIPVAELEAAVKELRWLDRANPCAPERTDGRLRAWWDLAGRLAEQIRNELPGTSELIVIPGRVLMSTPLLAAGWPDRPLIADRPVSAAPNHRLLLGRDGRHRDDRHPPLGVVAVPRAQDAAEFRQQLDGLLDEIERDHPGVVVLRNADGDEAAVLEAWQQVRTLLLLCHGVHGGPVLGPGICVAARGILPPSYLPVERDPALGAFVLSWEDLLGAVRSPEVLVSVACASGRTSVGKGGSRLGLEQGSLATGTRFSIAPLWWVDQESSLAWVRAFIERGHEPDVPTRYQDVVLRIRSQFPHPYHWAPYTLSTALRGGEP